MPAHDSDRHRRGVLVDWNDERCLGIEPSDGGAGVFAHISAFPAGRRPAKGCEASNARAVMSATGPAPRTCGT